MRYWYRERQVKQRNRIEIPELDSRINRRPPPRTARLVCASHCAKFLNTPENSPTLWATLRKGVVLESGNRAPLPESPGCSGRAWGWEVYVLIHLWKEVEGGDDPPDNHGGHPVWSGLSLPLRSYSVEIFYACAGRCRLPSKTRKASARWALTSHVARSQNWI